MIISKVVICNLALASLGEDAIRDFSEGNTRARMCEVFYETSRDYLLGQFDWPFARRQQKLAMLSTPPDWTSDGTYCYALPADCFAPINLWPEGSRHNYEIRGKNLYCQRGEDQDVVLMYSVHVQDPTLFSTGFVNLLALAIAVRLAPTLTQDKQLTQALFQQYEVEKKEVWANDAMQGNEYPFANDDNPDYDTFVREL